MTATCISCHKPREIVDPTRDACPCGGKCWSWNDGVDDKPRFELQVRGPIVLSEVAA